MEKEKSFPIREVLRVSLQHFCKTLIKQNVELCSS